eukprot:GFUD01026877.1.p1 GENE.GFUD01026877.1~~GFUD01026877.1.p1  ORF type:complete len:382 (-),score=91.35 GFUD01026877.1:44-1189(-)
MNKIARFSLGSLGGQKLNPKSRVVLPVLQRYYSDESDDKKKAQDKLAALLKGLKTSESAKKSPDRELKLAKPGFKRPIKRGKDGKPEQLISSAELDSDVVEATKSVARLAKNENKKRRTESDLLKKLKSVAKDATEAKEDNEVAGESDETLSLSSLFSNIKIEKNPIKKAENFRSAPDGSDRKGRGNQQQEKEKKDLTMEQLAFLQKRQKMRRAENLKSQEQGSVDLFSGTPLGIFTGPMEDSADKDMLKTWRACQERELRILSTPSPRNALEEMVLHTKQGKLWHFPVDNEQGLDYSSDPFYNHVFLEHNLEPWCPKMGPVRHFMEVVCLGLSKNPYVSSQKKLDTILWFKDYFERPENNEILIHSGFWEEANEEASLSA